jgi:very-short-patch-repair endonuclease
MVSDDKYTEKVVKAWKRIEALQLNIEKKVNNKLKNKRNSFKKVKGGSSGEKKIERYLLKNKIQFEKQKKFSNCMGESKPLRFDFYLPKFNCCIEFDGIYHDKPIIHKNESKKKAESRFLKSKNYDQRKDSYCKKVGIKLKRIHYKEYNNISKILGIFLNSKR